MDKKQQLSVPKYIWVIAAILVACIIFFVFVQYPFIQKYPSYQTAHASATAQISLYNDTLKNADSIQAEVDKMKKSYEDQSDKLFTNALKTSDDIQAMLQKLDYDLSTVKVEKGVVDTQGRISSAGNPLYSTVIDLTCTVTEQKLIETLKYFEEQSTGSYYVSKLTVAPVDDTQTSAQASTAVKTASDKDMYNVQITMNLYYFNQDITVATSGASGASGAKTSSK